MLKPGGMLLYSTCTFDASENEQTIEYLISQYPEFAVCPIEPYDGFTQGMPEVGMQGGNPGLAETVRIFPHRMKGEGHYLALLKKHILLNLRRMGIDRNACQDRGRAENCRRNWQNFCRIRPGSWILPGWIYMGRGFIICRTGFLS